MRIRRWRLAAGCAAASASTLLAPSAAADGQVVLGGGAGIVVEGSYCTLGTIGRDKTGALVGFSAGHCGGPGAPVVAEGSGVPVGTVAAVGDGLDYAVIKLDPAKVTPTANFAGFAINGIGPEPDFHQPACKQGGATGAICGYIDSLPGPGPNINMRGFFQPGDDGGPATSDNRLFAMILSGHVITPQSLPPIPVTHLVKFSAVLNDVNAKGGPGEGFTPI